MQKIDTISFNELSNVFETDESNDNYKIAAENLLKALNDWPTKNLSEPSELIFELKQDIHDKLTYDNISVFLSQLKPQNDAWKIESVSYLLELFDFERSESFDRKIELEVIIEKITKHYRGKSSR